MTILDTTALIEHARGSIYLGALLATATRSTGGALRVPVSALAEAWQRTTPGDRYRLEYLAVAAPVQLDVLDADNVFDVADSGGRLGLAHAVYLARLHHEVIVTADPAAYAGLEVAVEPLP